LTIVDWSTYFTRQLLATDASKTKRARARPSNATTVVASVCKNVAYTVTRASGFYTVDNSTVRTMMIFETLYTFTAQALTI
jgi:hypothetical protein